MEIGWDQMVAVALLTIAAAVGIGTLLLALSLSELSYAGLSEPVFQTTLLWEPVGSSALLRIRSRPRICSPFGRTLTPCRGSSKTWKSSGEHPRAGSLSKGPVGESERLTREPPGEVPWADAPLGGRPALDLSEPRFRRG